MAWLSLVITAIFFFTPVFGFGSSIVEQGARLKFQMPFGEVAISIPFLGPLQLFAYSVGTWLVLWLLPLYIEKVIMDSIRVSEKDLGGDVDKKSRRLRKIFAIISLRSHLVYVSRPYISLHLAERIAPYIFGGTILKLILPVLLQLALSTLIPWLSSQAVPWLASMFARELVAFIAPLITTGLENLLQRLLGFINHLGSGAILGVFSVLVVIAVRAFAWEKEYRYRIDLEFNQPAKNRK